MVHLFVGWSPEISPGYGVLETSIPDFLADKPRPQFDVEIWEKGVACIPVLTVLFYNVAHV